MQRRTTIWLAGLWSLLFGTATYALSLGDIEVYSALGSPLEAEILLTSVRSGETDGMLVKLAPEEAFVQAGVDRPFYLTKIKFQLATKLDGTQYINVTTDNPVNEPFLNFLIDIDWPRGHLVREYTVMLDPPVFTSTGQTATARDPVAETLPELADAESAAGVPALIQRDAEDTAQSEELPDIEMIDETDGVAATEADLGADELPAFAEMPVEDIPVADDISSGPDPVMTDALPEEAIAEEPEDITQDTPAVAADTGGDWDARLEQQSLPDIGFEYDESLPYDAARTEALLEEFGISLASVRAESEQAESAAERGDSYEVQEGDTLWEIASQHKEADVTVQQAMLAILRYNPNGFIRNNINDVKKGFVLRMPERQAMREISRQEAAAEVQRQYALWREYRGELAGISSAQQDAADSQAGTAATGDTSAGGQLSILAPGRDAESTTRSSGAQEGEEKGSATRMDLQLAREQLEAERLEKTELKSRLTDLTGQIETMQRLLTLKDEQLAKLQERLRQLEAAAAAPAATPSVPQEPQAKTTDQSTPAEKTTTATDKAAAEKILAEEPPVDIKPGTDSPAPDMAGAAPQPETTTSDTQDKPAAQSDIEKLNESLDISLQPEQPAEIADSPAKKPRTKPVQEVPQTGGKSFPERLDATLQPIQGFLRDLVGQHLPAPYNKMADDLLATPAGLGIVAGVLLLLLALVLTLVRSAVKAKDKVKEKIQKPKKSKPAKVIIGAPDHLETPPEQLETAKFTAKPAKKAGPSLSERLKKAFAPFATLLAKKPKPAKAAAEDENIENEAIAAEEDLASAVQEAAVEVKSKAKPKPPKAEPAAEHGETVKVKSTPSKPAAPAAEEEISDDTTAEADVYLAYGLFDQAEELLKHALASNPGAIHYRGKLLETYFAAGKKDEFEKLAAELHKSVGSRPSRVWDKAVAMGKEIAPSNALFSGAADSGLKASDFAPAKPATADLDLGEAGGATTPDVDFGEVGPTETALDLDISGAFDKTVIADDKTMIADDSTMIADDSTMIADDRTMIADDSTMLVDETSLDGPKPKDVTDSELSINFDADELGLGSELEETDSPGVPEMPAEATMAMDIGLDIENIEGITDVDAGSGSFNSNSAGDDLIAELGESELSLEGASSDTEFDLPEDDDTIIDAGEDDTFSGDSASEDEVSTKIDLAKAYMDMGDYDGASSTLEEVLSEGNDKQKREAEELLDQIN